MLIKGGAKVDYYDPYVPIIKFEENEIKSSKTLMKNKLRSYDVCVVVTDHSNVDYELVHDNCTLIIDTRNVFKGKSSAHVKRLGQG